MSWEYCEKHNIWSRADCFECLQGQEEDMENMENKEMKDLMINFEVNSTYHYDGLKLNESDFKKIQDKIKKGIRSLMYEILEDDIFYNNDSDNSGESDFIINDFEIDGTSK